MKRILLFSIYGLVVLILAYWVAVNEIVHGIKECFKKNYDIC